MQDLKEWHNGVCKSALNKMYQVAKIYWSPPPKIGGLGKYSDLFVMFIKSNDPPNWRMKLGT